jgi:hypothetical protein
LSTIFKKKFSRGEAPEDEGRMPAQSAAGGGFRALRVPLFVAVLWKMAG